MDILIWIIVSVSLVQFAAGIVIMAGNINEFKSSARSLERSISERDGSNYNRYYYEPEDYKEQMVKFSRYAKIGLGLTLTAPVSAIALPLALIAGMVWSINKSIHSLKAGVKSSIPVFKYQP